MPRQPKEKPFCESMSKWLQGQVGAGCLAPCTGQDYRALKAFVHLVDLYGCADGPGREQAIVAMRAAVLAMQPKMRLLAKKSIPHMLDWGDEALLWAKMFGAGAVPGEFRRCPTCGDRAMDGKFTCGRSECGSSTGQDRT